MTDKIKPNSYAALDAAHHFHPYSNAKRIENQGPMVIAKGKGIKVWVIKVTNTLKLWQAYGQ